MKTTITVMQSWLDNKWYLVEHIGNCSAILFPDKAWNTKAEAEKFAALL